MISCYTSELLALGGFFPNQMEVGFIESIEKKTQRGGTKVIQYMAN